MHVGRHTTAQSAEIQFFGVHLSVWLSVGKERVCGTGLPTVMRKNQPLVPRSNFGAQEPTPGSAVEHCRFLDTGGGGTHAPCDSDTAKLLCYTSEHHRYSGNGEP